MSDEFLDAQESRKEKLRTYQREYQRVWRLTHKEEVKASTLKWRAKNWTRFDGNRKAWSRRDRKSNPEKYASKHKAWRIKNSDRAKAQQRQYRLDNLEKRKAHCRDWYHKNKTNPAAKSKMLESGRISYQKHKSTVLAGHKKWRQSRPELVHWYKSKRRALEKSAEINLHKIKEWMRDVKSRAYTTCYFCQKDCSSKVIHFDHIVPLFKGGSHSVDNLCVSCQFCNLSKGKKLISEWLKKGQQVLPI